MSNGETTLRSIQLSFWGLNKAKQTYLDSQVAAFVQSLLVAFRVKCMETKQPLAIQVPNALLVSFQNWQLALT